MQDVTRQDLGAARWADDQTRLQLQVLVEGVATLAGFEQSAISLRREGFFEIVAAAGIDDEFIGRQVPAESIEEELAGADEWGVWRFVPHQRASAEALEYSHIPDVRQLDGDDAWHPLDLLSAPLYDDQGRIRGLLSVDAPRDGRLPGPEKLDVLTRYAGLARTLLLLALEREELALRVRMASEAREIVRQALGEPTLDLVLQACRSTIVDCFDAVGMWLTAFDADGGTSTVWFAEGVEKEPPFNQIDDVVVGLAHHYWAQQTVAPFCRALVEESRLPTGAAERLLAFLEHIGIGSVLFVPLGAGTECLGFLALTWVSDDREWTDVEGEAALDIGRDLGRAIANARQLERERAVVDQLRTLDNYRVEMVNTLGHELKNPLFSLSANLELLELAELAELDQKSLDAAVRSANRMRTVIEDLLTMARMSDPQREFRPVPVDVCHLVRDILDECAVTARNGSVDCVVDLPDGEVLAPGHAEELYCAVINLVSNAVKYTEPGGRVTVRVTQHGEKVVVEVADTGIGISVHDQEQLFGEFFRSTNPEALAKPGTGLGLAIVSRIVDRHAGRITIDSERGRGTTARITLPALVRELVPEPVRAS